MPITQRNYGNALRHALIALRETGDFGDESFAAFLHGRGVVVGASSVRNWVSGTEHLPAEVLPLLVAYLSEYGGLARWCELTRDAFAPAVEVWRA